MSTTSPKLSLEQALTHIPQRLRKRLLPTYVTIKSQQFTAKPDTIGHQAGKIAEVLLRVLQQLLTQTYIPLSQGINNFKDECERLERTPKTAGPEGLRILMPRALLFLYTLRNKRDFGHVGGEVDANQVDASTAIRISDWCMCELLRVQHNIPIENAEQLCNAIGSRQLPVVWSTLGRKRVLNTSLNYRDQTLLLLYSDLAMAVPSEDLFEWTEHSHKGNYCHSVLGSLHKDRLVEWDKETEMVLISPKGILDVENRILPLVNT